MAGSSSDFFSTPYQGSEIDQLGGFESQMRLAGDYYNDHDDVRRGVTMESMPNGMGLAHMDFLPFQDDNAGCTRSAFEFGIDGTLGGFQADSMPIYDPSDAYGFELSNSHAFAPLEPWEPLEPPCFALTRNTISKEKTRSSRLDIVFAEVHRPHPLPVDPFFALANTSFCVIVSSACMTMNKLMEFLATEVSSDITKVGVHKCTIKAEVFLDGLSCSIKIRAYPLENRNYPDSVNLPAGAFAEDLNDADVRLAVEFQRRKGDGVCFNNVFHMAREYCQPSSSPMDARAGITEACIPPDPSPMVGDDAVAELTPLFDMSRARDMPQIQAEAVAALPEKARDPKYAAALSTAEAIDCFKELLRHSRFDILYPTSKLMHALAVQPGAQQCFRDEGVMVAVVEKAASAESPPVVQQEMAQAVSSIVATVCAEFPQRLRERLETELDRALLGFADDTTSLVYQNLRQACTALKFPGHLVPAEDPVQYMNAGQATVARRIDLQSGNFEVFPAGLAADTVQRSEPSWPLQQS